jgi:hypothetical protein
VVIDDGMLNGGFSKAVCDLFTRLSHHRELTVFLVTQNLYFNSPFSREISRNSTYLIFFRNPRDITTLTTLVGQLEGRNSGDLTKIIKEILEPAHSNLLVDLHQKTKPFLKYRYDVFNKSKAIVSSDFLKNCENGEIEGIQSFITDIDDL